jgi:hypothetical protein
MAVRLFWDLILVNFWRAQVRNPSLVCDLFLIAVLVKSWDMAGIKKKKMGVIFKNMTVVGEGADASSIPNLLSPFEAAWEYVNPLSW